MSVLVVNKLTRQYRADDVPAVDDLSLTVETNELFALVGPTGCGKTTTLRAIAGFERPDGGVISLGDQVLDDGNMHIPPDKRDIGLVFQELALFPHMSVNRNVEFGLKGMAKGARRNRAAEVLEMVGMSEFADRRPHELSGGQQQRVALARSIAPSPRLLLLDEPFSSLDPGLRDDMRLQIKKVLAETGTSALLVTHDHEEALSMADRVGVMRLGKLCQVGKPDEVYHRPCSAFVSQFLGRTNLLEATAVGDVAETSIGRVELTSESTGRVTVSVRPEHLRLEAPGNGEMTGEVIAREFKGHDLTFVVRYGDQTYTVQTDYSCPFVVGQSVRLRHAEPAVVVEEDRDVSGADC